MKNYFKFYVPSKICRHLAFLQDSTWQTKHHMHAQAVGTRPRCSTNSQVQGQFQQSIPSHMPQYQAFV